MLAVLLALVFAVGAAIFSTAQIAYADSSVEVVKAPVSNLEGNATAGKSTVAVFDNENRTFYIPESYYLSSPTTIVSGMIYGVQYAGETFFLREQPVTSQINVADDEVLSPDVRLFVKEDANVVLGTQAINNEYTIKFLGYNEDGTEIYVSATFNGSAAHGFIATTDLEPFTVPYQQRAQEERDALLAALEAQQKNPFGVNPKNTSVALRIILIIGIAVPTVIIVFLLFKPSKNDRKYAKNTVRGSRSRDDFDYDDSRSYRRDRDR
ncbi:MAG: hypothetical protein K2M36_00360, partial [Clostridia bacterium]|nr:hypothetical protein [Clostridia bacterium]